MVKDKDEYYEIFKEMIQHSLPFHKIARTNHRHDFECLAILLHLELVYCENAVLIILNFMISC